MSTLSPEQSEQSDNREDLEKGSPEDLKLVELALQTLQSLYTKELLQKKPNNIEELIGVLEKTGINKKKLATFQQKITELNSELNSPSAFTKQFEKLQGESLSQFFSLDVSKSNDNQVDQHIGLALKGGGVHYFGLRKNQSGTWVVKEVLNKEQKVVEHSIEDFLAFVPQLIEENKTYVDSQHTAIYKQLAGSAYLSTVPQVGSSTNSIEHADTKLTVPAGQTVTLADPAFSGRGKTINNLFATPPQELVLDYQHVSPAHKERAGAVEGLVRAYYDETAGGYRALNGARAGKRPLIYQHMSLTNVSHQEETIENEINTTDNTQKAGLTPGKKYIFAQADRPRIDRMLKPGQGPLRLDYSMTKRAEKGIKLAYRDGSTYVDENGQRALVFDSVLIESLASDEHIREQTQAYNKQIKETIRGATYTLSELFPDKVNNTAYQKYFDEFSNSELAISDHPTETFASYEDTTFLLHFTLDDAWFNSSYHKDLQVDLAQLSDQAGSIDNEAFIQYLKKEVETIIATYFIDEEDTQQPEQREHTEGSISVAEAICLDCVPTDSFKQGIAGVESAGEYNIVNKGRGRNASSAIGKYQHLRGTRGDKITSYIASTGSRLLTPSDPDWRVGEEEMLSNSYIKNRWGHDTYNKQYIITYLMRPELQEGFMSSYVKTDLARAARSVRNRLSAASNKYHPAELMALCHFLGAGNTQTFLKYGRNALSKQIRGANVSATDYLSTFSRSYNRHVATNYAGDDNYAIA